MMRERSEKVCVVLMEGGFYFRREFQVWVKRNKLGSRGKGEEAPHMFDDVIYAHST